LWKEAFVGGGKSIEDGTNWGNSESIKHPQKSRFSAIILRGQDKGKEKKNPVKWPKETTNGLCPIFWIKILAHSTVGGAGRGGVSAQKN